MFDYIVIGAGIVGLATAWRVQCAEPAARIVVIDKERVVAAHQSSHNSGVIHAGVYYPPHSLKARFCRLGAAATLRFCADHALPARQCGKLIVATEGAESDRLRALAERAAGNGIDCEWLDADAIHAREPRVRGHSAIHVAQSGIADYPAICRKLAELLRDNGAELALGEAVTAIRESAAAIDVETGSRRYTGARLVVCAGLQADRLARLAGLDPDCAIVPFRGDYYRLPPARSGLVSTLIYPVPDPRLPFLGVHLTLTTDGGLTLGPTAMLAFAREHYAKWACDLDDMTELLGYPGTWRLLARFPRAGVTEFAYACSRRLYLRAARRYCPSLRLADLAVHTCGIRAQAVNRRGEMLNDFLFEQTARSVFVLNAPSPAATSAFPIADAIVARLKAARI